MHCQTSLIFLVATVISFSEALERGIYPRQNPPGAPASSGISAQSYTLPTWVISLETGTDLDAFCALVESFPGSSCKHQLTAMLHGVIIEASPEHTLELEHFLTAQRNTERDNYFPCSTLLLLYLADASSTKETSPPSPS